MTITKKYFITCFISALLFSIDAISQQPILVAESSVKVGIKGEEFVFFGFAAGDQLIFSFEEANGKDMKEVEILEMPANSRFIEYKTSKLENKTITIPRTSIYKFRFANSALLPRVCKYKIQRIPGSAATQNFNSTVYVDTYYDTTYTTETENYIDRSDTVISNFQERVVKVNPPTAPGSSKSNFNFTLPENTVAWSYYISTTPTGKQVYQDALKKLGETAVREVTKFPSYGPLAALAMESESQIVKLDTGLAINYWIIEPEYVQLFTNGEQFRFIKKGRGSNDFSKMDPRDRAFYFCLHNDNKTIQVPVTVKITAILVNEKFETRQVQKMQVTPRRGMHLRN
jgi:hypothetical protein